MDWIASKFVRFAAESEHILYDLIGRVFIRCLSEQNEDVEYVLYLGTRNENLYTWIESRENW